MRKERENGRERGSEKGERKRESAREGREGVRAFEYGRGLSIGWVTKGQKRVKNGRKREIQCLYA